MSDTKESCLKTTAIKVLQKEDVEECGFKFTAACNHTKLPDGGYAIGMGEPCPTEQCPTCPVLDGEPIAEGCTIVASLADEEVDGCDWLPDVCIPSVPPALGCAPIFGGEGGYDGGVAKWTHNCLTECELAIIKQTQRNAAVYIQGNWEHVLDLATHPEHTAQLMVRYDGNPREINTQEWNALAFKLGRTSVRTGALKEFANESNVGIAFVDLGNGTYGLSTTINGVAVGEALPLVSNTNAAGDVTSITFPLPT